MSPAIPAIADMLLAALWGFSVFAGWNMAAFCDNQEVLRHCADRLASAVRVSWIFALVAGVTTGAGWLVWRAGSGRVRSNQVLGVAILSWVIALAVLFIGGQWASGQ